MKYIKNYADQAAYDADQTRPTDASVVSLIQASKNVRYNGVNFVAEVDYASQGDTVVYDIIDERPKVVKLGTLKLPLPERYIISGTVASVSNEFVDMIANQQFSDQWGAPKLMRLTGLTPSNFTITINSTVTPVIDYLTTDSLSDLAAKIQAAIQTVMTAHAAGWTAFAYLDTIIVRQNSYTPNVTSLTCSDANVAIEFLNENYQTATSGLLNNSTQIFRNDGSVTTWAGCHLDKFIEYYSVNGEDVTGREVGVGNVIRESRFNMTDNPLLFAYYGTYRNYVADKMGRYPYGKGIMNDQSGKENTRILAEVTYIDHEGVIRPAYPAASRANDYGIEGTPFGPGEWWLSSTPEWMPLMRGITYRFNQYPLDPISRGLRDVGAPYIDPNTYYWMSSEYGGLNAWAYHGPNGRMNANSKDNALTVRPVTAFRKKNI